MAFVGMDTALAQSQLSQFNNQGVDAIQNIINTAGPLVDQIAAPGSGNWKGQDATRFHGEWVGTHNTSLHNVLTALQQFAQTFQNNITEQNNASA